MKILVVLLVAVVATAQPNPNPNPKPKPKPKATTHPTSASHERKQGPPPPCEVRYILPHSFPPTPPIYEQTSPPLGKSTGANTNVIPTFKRIDLPPRAPIEVVGYNCHFDKEQPRNAPPYGAIKWNVRGADLATIPDISRIPVK